MNKTLLTGKCLQPCAFSWAGPLEISFDSVETVGIFCLHRRRVPSRVLVASRKIHLAGQGPSCYQPPVERIWPPHLTGPLLTVGRGQQGGRGGRELSCPGRGDYKYTTAGFNARGGTTLAKGNLFIKTRGEILHKLSQLIGVRYVPSPLRHLR